MRLFLGSVVVWAGNLVFSAVSGRKISMNFGWGGSFNRSNAKKSRDRMTPTSGMDGGQTGLSHDTVETVSFCRFTTGCGGGEVVGKDTATTNGIEHSVADEWIPCGVGAQGIGIFNPVGVS